MTRTWTILGSCAALAACSTPPERPPAPPGFWFDSERYLSSDYLAAEPTTSCEVTERGWTEVGADLPDGSWFTVQASESDFPEPIVTLARGWTDAADVPAAGLILYPNEGIVRSSGPERTRSFGIRSQMGVWMAQLGRRVLALDCDAIARSPAS